MNRHIGVEHKQVGLVLVTCFFMIFTHSSATSWAGHSSKGPMEANPSIIFQNDRLTIKAKAVPLQDLLDRVAKTCDLRIFSATADKAALVSVELHEHTIEQALKELLRGHSYLTIYNEDSEKSGLVIITGTQSSPEGQVTAPPIYQAATTAEIQKANQIKLLRNKIERLDKKIARGGTEKSNQTDLETNSPGEMDDREKLEIYQLRLSMLEGGEGK